MASSYDRVFRLLNETDEAKKIRTRIAKAYEEARITGWKFWLTTDDKERPFAGVTFTTRFVAKSEFRYYDREGLPSRQVYLDPLALTDSTEIKEIVYRHFGHDVPTFFCRKEVVLAGCSKERGRKTTDSFPQWFGDAVKSEFYDAKLEAERRILEAASVIVESPEFKEERHQALLRGAKADLVKMMQKYAPLGEEFLREALQEFVVADVLEG